MSQHFSQKLLSLLICLAIVLTAFVMVPAAGGAAAAENSVQDETADSAENETLVMPDKSQKGSKLAQTGYADAINWSSNVTVKVGGKQHCRAVWARDILLGATYSYENYDRAVRFVESGNGLDVYGLKPGKAKLVITTESYDYVTIDKPYMKVNMTYNITVVGNTSSSSSSSSSKTTTLATPKVTKIASVYTGQKIFWNKVSGAAKYRVFIKSGGSWKKLADTTATSYINKKAKSGKKYAYTVRCISSNGKKFTSNYNKTGKTGLYIAAPRIKSFSDSAAGAKIKWGKISGASKYRVFIKSGGSWKKLADTKSTSYLHKITDGNKHIYTVRCLNAKGSFISAYNTSGWSHTAPAQPKIKSFTNTSNGVKINLTAVKGTAKYRIFIKSSGSWKKLADTKSTSYLHKITDGKSHTYTVRCLNASGKFCSTYNTTGWSHTAPKVIQPTSVMLDKSSMTLKVTLSDSGTTYDGKYLWETVYPTNATNKSITWSSSNTRVATVSSYGYVRAVGSGTATITAKTVNGKTASCRVTVASVDNRTVLPTSIYLDAYSTTMYITASERTTTYDSKYLYATVYPTNATNKIVTWSTSDSSVVSVSGNGYIRAESAGTAYIYAKTSNGKTASCKVTVIYRDTTPGAVLPTDLIFDTYSMTLTIRNASSTPIYETRYIWESFTPSDTTNKKLVWTTSNPGVATVNSVGLVKAVAPGTATISARTVNGIVKNCTVKVVNG